MDFPFVSTVALALVLTSQALGQATITNGSLTVTVNHVGVLTQVPTGGLETFEGRLVQLLPGQAEWFGVSYNKAGWRPEYVATGLESDWALGRRAVVQKNFSFHADSATSVVLAGDLKLTTTATGPLAINTSAPVCVPAGTSFYFQVGVLDAGAPAGIAFSNAMAGSFQP